MPFASYSSMADVARRYRIRCRRAEFITPVEFSLSEVFRSELNFTLSAVAFESSESAASETLIYPLLRAVWKPFHEVLTLWSHEAIAYDDDLSGVPDYIVARRSPLGPLIFDLPIVLVVEAKKDDFTRGWGQCLAAMLAAQKLTDLPDQTFYGIATNGRVWEFGELRGDVFTQNQGLFSLRDLDGLSAALHFVMIRCREQVLRQPAAI